MNPCRILIVEDEAVVAMDIEDRLTGMGYQPSGRAVNGQQALAFAAEQRPDLVLMDVGLRKSTNGVDAAEEMRTRFHVPVVFLDVRSGDATLDGVEFSEPFSLIQKPFDDRDLKSAIEIALYKHRAEEELRRLTRFYDVLSQVSRAIVHSKSREELLSAVCRHVVERGGIDRAWVGWLEPGTARIRTVARFGTGSDIADQVGSCADDRPEDSGNPCRAILEGKPFVCNECRSAGCFCGSGQVPGRCRFQSGGSFPLRLQGRVCAVLGLCVAVPEFFREREIRLLEEVALHVSYALDKIEGDAQREQAEKSLEEAAVRRRILIDQSRDGIVVLDQDGKIVEANQRFVDMLGYSAEESRELHVWDWDLRWTREELLEGIKSVGPAGDHFETRHRRKDGTSFDVDINANGAVFAGQKLVFCVSRDITERKEAEAALRASEERVRLKLDSILSPEGDIGHLDLADFIDVQGVQALLDDFYALAHFPVSIIDLNGRVLIGVGWQDICVKFHRANPDACRHCMESDLQLSEGIPPGEFRLYKCKNNMWDVATPVSVGGRHLGNLFSGQFFFEDERPDYELFRSQARRYGFNEEDYLAAVESVPRLSRSCVDRGMAFLAKLAQMLSLLGYSNIKLARSLTERSALMESVRESEQRLSLALAASRMGVWEWDARTGSVFWSPECGQILSLESTPGTVEDFTKAVHPDDLARVMATVERALAEKTPFVEEFRIIHRGGGERWVSNLGRAEYDESDKPLRLVGTIQDITERRQAEEEQTRVEAQLRQAQKMEALGTLAGGIAHDFNNILGIILGYSEMAHWDADEGSPVRTDLQHVFRATNRARELVRQILAFSRRSEQEKKPIQVGLIVKEAMLMLRASLPSTIDMKLNAVSKAVVMADPTQIHQVLMNLCTNAAHAMRENGGVLEVSLTDVSFEPESIPPQSDLQPGPYVELIVKDTGLGIAPGDLERIFDPFFTTKELGVGTGLGLSVVDGSVKSHGGTVAVESQPGRGATFRVLLPAMETAPGPEAVTTAPLPPGRERILIVDDEPELAMVAKQMLEFLGYEVEYRTNGIDALETFRLHLQENPFHLVVTDMTMPQLTGEDLARELLSLQPKLPIILCTGFSEKMDVRKAKSLGIRGFLMKPVVASELAGMIRQMLDNWLQ